MKKLGSFLLFFALAAAPAMGSDLTIFGGFQRPEKLSLQSAREAGSSFRFNPKSFGVFGIRYSKGRVFGTEQTFAYSPNFIESETKAVIYNSNIIVQVPAPRVHPYGTLGLGGVFMAGNGIGDFGSKFAVNYGAGIKAIVSGPFGLGVDVRGYTIPKIQGSSLNVLEVSLGAVFNF